MIKISFHLYDLKQTIDGKEYKCQSTGGRVLLLVFILGMLARYFGYTDMSIFTISVFSLICCLAWDFLILAFFFSRMEMLAKGANENE